MAKVAECLDDDNDDEDASIAMDDSNHRIGVTVRIMPFTQWRSRELKEADEQC